MECYSGSHRISLQNCFELDYLYLEKIEVGMPFYVNEYNVYIDIWSSRESHDLKMSVSEIVIVLCPLFHFLDECPTSWHATLVQMTGTINIILLDLSDDSKSSWVKRFCGSSLALTHWWHALGGKSGDLNLIFYFCFIYICIFTIFVDIDCHVS